MLVLSRKCDEQILIHDTITVTILKTGSTVKLGIDAPKEMTIRRGEKPVGQTPKVQSAPRPTLRRQPTVLPCMGTVS